MKRYFEVGVYNTEKSDGSGMLERFSSMSDAKESISTFTKEPEQIFIIDELEEQDDGSVRQLAQWMYR